MGAFGWGVYSMHICTYDGAVLAVWRWRWRVVVALCDLRWRDG